MEGHRRGECEGSTEPSESGSQNDSDDNDDLTRAVSNGEVKGERELETFWYLIDGLSSLP